MDKIYSKKPEECAYSFTQHTACEFFPCHKTAHPEDFNCLFCYCPLYTLGSRCGGNFKYLENGVKDCSNCLLPHGRGSYSYVISKFPELMELREDHGGNTVIRRHEKDLVLLEVEQQELTDVDTPQAMADLKEYTHM